MWRQIFKTFLITLIVVLAVGATVIYFFKHRPQSQILESKPPLPLATTLKDNTSQVAYSSEIRQRFIQEGWTTSAADEVIKLNGEWFTMLRRVDPLAYSKQITLLADLGNYQGLMPFLEDHPESCALFTVSEDPTVLLRLLESSGGDYDFLVNLYVLHGSPIYADQLTSALQNNADMIAKLYRRGLVGSEVIFFFDRNDEGAAEYDQWLREILASKMDKSDDELASLLNMVLKYGPEIRIRLRTNDSFRIAFRAKIWPRLVRVATDNHNMFDIYLDDPRVWDLLTLPEGEELMRLRGPLLPIDLLYGYPELGRSPYPPDLHGTVIQALLQGDEPTIRALLKFRDAPLFHALARRSLSPSVKAAAFKKLFESGDNYHDLLRHYNKLSDKALRSEVGPPPSILKIWTPFYYTFWEVPKKLSEGRNPTTTDWFNSLADPVSFLYPILKLGVAVVNVGKTVTDSAQDDESDQNLKKTSIKYAEKQLGAALAAKLSDKELITFGVTGMLAKMQQAYRETVSGFTIVDSTGPVRFMISYSDIGRSSMEPLDIIDGRILLRGDARLVIQPGNDSPAREVSSYLTASVNNFIAGSHSVSHNSSHTSSNGKQSFSAHNDLTAWRHNVSAWWLMQAGGMLHKM